MTHLRSIAVLLVLSMGLSACSTVSGWFDEDKEKTKIEGERIAILSEKRGLEAPENPTPIELPEASLPNVWLQAFSNARHVAGAIGISGDFSEKATATVGDGEDWAYRLVPAPVIAGNKVFAIDAEGVVSAHSTNDVSHIVWKKDIYDGDDSLMSAGLAIAQDQLIVALSDGTVVALNYPTGHELWRRQLGTPIRSAPAIDNNTVYLVSADNQLVAMDAATGSTLWQHRGILENASLLGTVVPAAAGGVVIAAYTSGEVFALSGSSGKPIWSDSLVLPQRTAALSAFSGIGGSPVISGSLVYTLSQNGLAAANDVRTGIRAWERPITSYNTPWVAGDDMFVLTDGSVVAIHAIDGQIAWKSDLPADDDKDTVWSGPVLIGKEIYVFSSAGTAYALDAATGKQVAQKDFISSVVSTPAFAQGKMFVVDESSTLHVFQ